MVGHEYEGRDAESAQRQLGKARKYHDEGDGADDEDEVEAAQEYVDKKEEAEEAKEEEEEVQEEDRNARHKWGLRHPGSADSVCSAWLMFQK
jgi:hypothetical protein